MRVGQLYAGTPDEFLHCDNGPHKGGFSAVRLGGGSWGEFVGATGAECEGPEFREVLY